MSKIYLDCTLWTLIDLIKKKNPAETMIDTDYADDLALLTNASALVESLLHRMKLAERERK